MMDMAIRIPQEKLEVLKADLIFYSKQKLLISITPISARFPSLLTISTTLSSDV
jgi:hypothetical protein